MNYAITRMPPDELRHYGIKGQKWGVRRYENPDGTLTPEGRERYRSNDSQRELAGNIKKTLDSLSPMNDHHVNKVLNTPQVKEIRSKIKSLTDTINKAQDDQSKMVADWYDRKNPKMYYKYAQLYAEKSSKEYGDGSKKDINERLWAILNDDLDQGDTFRMYMNDNPEVKKKYDSYQDVWTPAVKTRKELIKNYANEFLGEYGNEQIPERQNKWNNNSFTVADQLYSIIAIADSRYYQNYK